MHSAESILSDPTASTWLRLSLQGALHRDPIDAANDAETLATVLLFRANAILAASARGGAVFAPAPASAVLAREADRLAADIALLVPEDKRSGLAAALLFVLARQAGRVDGYRIVRDLESFHGIPGNEGLVSIIGPAVRSSVSSVSPPAPASSVSVALSYLPAAGARP